MTRTQADRLREGDRVVSKYNYGDKDQSINAPEIGRVYTIRATAKFGADRRFLLREQGIENPQRVDWWDYTRFEIYTPENVKKEMLMNDTPVTVTLSNQAFTREDLESALKQLEQKEQEAVRKFKVDQIVYFNPGPLRWTAAKLNAVAKVKGYGTQPDMVTVEWIGGPVNGQCDGGCGESMFSLEPWSLMTTAAEPKTARELLDIVDRFLAQGTEEGRQAQAVLAALRGPDDDDQESKQQMTVPIRQAALPLCYAWHRTSGQTGVAGMDFGAKDLKTVRISKRCQQHFRSHAIRAAKALGLQITVDDYGVLQSSV